jgi:hypothetical protein
MALIVVFTNKSKLADVSDYNVGVFINDRQIYGGELKGHVRADGWEKLVTKFTNQLNKAKRLKK